ncbi:hypothetical protein H2201_006101 [Coniosporium apollinis]|uniref:DNA polymerase delta subunit 3 n=1 Tax=Coniosporium apollinis TaxID=61459 RepID=A0ABQ9NPL1_9PEZI|nr:hypothetical protein H2201_006101 [Coniosporium apollinis]
MDKYKEYLALNVLNEERIISYRALSRALKIHTHLAKQMLYAFHHDQNAKRPGSVHATYIIAGTKPTQQTAHTNGGPSQPSTNSFTQPSSPPLSSMPDRDGEEDHESEETISTTQFLVAREEDVEEAKAQFDEITSIHIYTLEPTPLKDLQVLTNCNREIQKEYAHEDPLKDWRQYGTVQNPNVKRRTNRRPPPPAAPVATTAAAKMAPRPSTTTIAKSTEPPPAKRRKSSESAASASRASTPQVDAAAIPPSKLEAKAKAPTLKRDKSDIFKSFAKSKPPKPKKQDTASSAEATPAPEDEPMDDASEDEQEEDFAITAPTVDDKAARQARKEREEALRNMMEDEDEPMEDAPEMQAVAEQQATLIDSKAEEEPEQKEEVTVSGGRRRGRRRVMKKQTVKDEEGYLVTKEEPVWESFSEDEPVPKKAKAPVSSGSAAKGKKGAKAGQGNIMSFFGKK